ncbi:MAG TPA: hypothetical protein VGR18_13970 [Rubrobacter sp.]|nr:hypothetical protein [Rubrobacter sp.]
MAPTFRASLIPSEAPAAAASITLRWLKGSPSGSSSVSASAAAAGAASTVLGSSVSGRIIFAMSRAAGAAMKLAAIRYSSRAPSSE